MKYKRTQHGKIVIWPLKDLNSLNSSYFALLTSKQHKETRKSKITVSGVYFYSQIHLKRSSHSPATSGRFFLSLKSEASACRLAPPDHSLEEA